MGVAIGMVAGNLVFFDCSGIRLMFFEGEQVNPSESTLYFRVPDIVVAYEELQKIRSCVYSCSTHDT